MMVNDPILMTHGNVGTPSTTGLAELKLDSYHAGFDAKESSTFQARRSKSGEGKPE